MTERWRPRALITPYSTYCIPSKSCSNAVMISTFAVIARTKGSYVKRLAICLRLKIMHNVIDIWTNTAITVITLHCFFANFGLFAPISLPIRAQKASCIPIGIIKINVLKANSFLYKKQCFLCGIQVYDTKKTHFKETHFLLKKKFLYEKRFLM